MDAGEENNAIQHCVI